MKNKYSHSLMVYMKKKHAYSQAEDKLQILADKLGGKFVGGGTDLTTHKRDQQYYFKSLENVETFLGYPTVKESILSEINIVPLDNNE
jgi:hypothetical protein